MKKIKIGNPQFPNRYVEKEFSDDKSSLQIAADLLFGICDKVKIADKSANPESLQKRSKDLKSMLDGFEKQINNLDPKLASEIRSKINKK